MSRFLRLFFASIFLNFIVFSSSLSSANARNGWQLLNDYSTVQLHTGWGYGSGVVVSRIGRKNIIVTAAHVIKDVSKQEGLDIIDNRSNIYSVKGANIIYVDKNYDIAFIWFESDECFFPARLADQYPHENYREPQIGQNVRVVGYSNVDPSISDYPIQREGIGSITTIIPGERSKNGYSMGYSSSTARSMSGGAVFTEWNKVYIILLGIHGKGERDDLRDSAKTGFNFGIPSKYIRESAQRAGIENKLSNGYIATNFPVDTINKTIMENVFCGNPHRGWSKGRTI